MTAAIKGPHELSGHHRTRDFGHVGRHWARRPVRHRNDQPFGTPAVLPPRICQRLGANRILFTSGRRSDHDLHRRRACLANLCRGCAVFGGSRGASDRGHWHGAGIGAGSGWPDDRRARDVIHRGRNRHNEGDRTDRCVDDAVDQSDEIPHPAARLGGDLGDAAFGRYWRRDRHYGRLFGGR